MESRGNPNFRGGNGDPIRFAEDLFPSISEENLQIESMGQETANIEQFLQDLIWSNPASEQNLSVNNPTAAEIESMRQQQPEPGQDQPADVSSAGSHHSRINCITEITAPDRRAKKREADRKYRENKKEKYQQMKLNMKGLEGENESLKIKFQEELENSKKKDEKHQEIEQQMKSTIKKLGAEIESLKYESILVTKKNFQIELEELKNRKKKYVEKLIEMEAANSVLRSQRMELIERLQSLDSVLQIVEEVSGMTVDIPDIPDSLMEPWQLPCPVQPIMAAEMFQC